MKELVFVVAVVLACVTTCGALKCRICAGAASKEACMNQNLTMCPRSQDVCMTTDTTKMGNSQLCKTSGDAFTCVYCCTTDGCVPGAASAARVSIVTMATVAMAVLLKNVAGI
uniref:UPAR/Ly6 domain-containing protein n=1 Tax=Branchiostoma floridae TaxID=7739 RepID=C3YTU2_BRAFL|eukprot:XP_002600207.1 hypothetical protein BRAFLDRAFT_66712 [Branchiostoma floridae]